MSKLMNKSLRSTVLYAGLVLVLSIPVYYFMISSLWSYEMSEHNVTLTAGAEREDRLLIIGAITIITICFFFLLICGLIFLNRFLARKLWEPFYNSLEKIRQFDINRSQKPVFEKTGIREFSELNENLDKLIDGSLSAFTQQKEFADNASHELQTPLAIVQSKLEQLSQAEGLGSGHFEIIGEAHEAVSRAIRINKNLLLQTRIESSQFSIDQELSVTAICRTAVSAFEPIAAAKNIKIRFEPVSETTVHGNHELLTILINNLLSNAIRHSPLFSVIEIVTDATRLVISNPGSKELNPDQMFRRFAKVSSDTPGTGLGLAIVKQIASLHSWNVSYGFRDLMHVFTISFAG